MPSTAQRKQTNPRSPKNQGSMSARNIKNDVKDLSNAKFSSLSKNTSNNEQEASSKGENTFQEKAPCKPQQLNNIPKPKLKLKD